MKYPKIVPMPTAVSKWLEEKLEALGLDATLYSRYILSVLYSDAADVIRSDENSHFAHLRRELRRSGGGRKRVRRSSWWSDALAEAEKLKRSAAVEFLMSASEEVVEVEELIEELYKKLASMDEPPKNTEQKEQIAPKNSTVHLTFQEKLLKYTAAFPPLNGQEDYCPVIKDVSWLNNSFVPVTSSFMITKTSAIDMDRNRSRYTFANTNNGSSNTKCTNSIPSGGISATTSHGNLELVPEIQIHPIPNRTERRPRRIENNKVLLGDALANALIKSHAEAVLHQKEIKSQANPFKPNPQRQNTINKGGAAYLGNLNDAFVWGETASTDSILEWKKKVARLQKIRDPFRRDFCFQRLLDGMSFDKHKRSSVVGFELLLEMKPFEWTTEESLHKINHLTNGSAFVPYRTQWPDNQQNQLSWYPYPPGRTTLEPGISPNFTLKRKGNAPGFNMWGPPHGNVPLYVSERRQHHMPPRSEETHFRPIKEGAPQVGQSFGQNPDGSTYIINNKAANLSQSRHIYTETENDPSCCERYRELRKIGFLSVFLIDGALVKLLDLHEGEQASKIDDVYGDPIYQDEIDPGNPSLCIPTQYRSGIKPVWRRFWCDCTRPPQQKGSKRTAKTGIGSSNIEENTAEDGRLRTEETEPVDESWARHTFVLAPAMVDNLPSEPEEAETVNAARVARSMVDFVLEERNTEDELSQNEEAEDEPMQTEETEPPKREEPEGEPSPPDEALNSVQRCCQCGRQCPTWGSCLFVCEVPADSGMRRHWSGDEPVTCQSCSAAEADRILLAHTQRTSMTAALNVQRQQTTSHSDYC